MPDHAPADHAHGPFPSMLLAAARAAASMLLVAALAACGGGGGSDEPGTPAAAAVAGGQSAAQTLGPAGGTLSLATPEGATFTLEVPAGALKIATALRIETAQASAAQRFQLRLLPAGLVLAAGTRATLSLALPASMQATSRTTLVYNGVPVPFSRAADGRLQLQLSTFADAPATGAVDPEAAQSQARRERAQAASTPACRGLPELGQFGEDTLTSTDAADVEIYGQCMVGAVQALAANRQFDAAVRLANATATFLQSTGSGDAQGFIQQATTQACTAYREALDDALAQRITTLGQIHERIRPILYWEKAIQQLGAGCTPLVGPDEYQTVINAMTAELAAVYAARKGAIVDVDGVEYTEAVAEARENEATVQQVQALPPAPAVDAAARQALTQTAQPALLDAMLQAPWQRCRDSGDMARLMELMIIMNSPASVKTAAQYCGTQLGARALAADGSTEVAALAPALGGLAAGAAPVTLGTLKVDTAGTLVLQGPVRALACPAGTEAAPEALEIRLNGQLLQTLSAGPYLASGLSINLADALRTAGIDAARFSSAQLTLHRTGNPCGGFWGEAPAPLLTLGLSGGRTAVLVFLDDFPESTTYPYQAEYLRLLKATYGEGSVALGSASEGAALFRSGRDVVLVDGGTTNSPDAINLVTDLQSTVEPWLRAGGHLLLHQYGLGVAAAVTPFGIGTAIPGPGSGHERCFTVTWTGGSFSVADSAIRGIVPLYPAPTSPLAAARVTGYDLNLMYDDDLADGWTDDPKIFPVNYDNVGQGEPVAGRRNVGLGRVLITTLTQPYAGYAGDLDPAYAVILRDLRGQ